VAARGRKSRLEELGRQMRSELDIMSEQLEIMLGKTLLTPSTRSDLRDLLGRVDDARFLVAHELDRSKPAKPWLRAAVGMGGSAALLVGGWLVDVGAGEVSQHYDLRNPITATTDAVERAGQVSTALDLDRYEFERMWVHGDDPLDRPIPYTPGTTVEWSVRRMRVGGDTVLSVSLNAPGADNERRIRYRSEDLGDELGGYSDEALVDSAMGQRPEPWMDWVELVPVPG
jgi:hypothetical protein